VEAPGTARKKNAPGASTTETAGVRERSRASRCRLRKFSTERLKATAITRGAPTLSGQNLTRSVVVIGIDHRPPVYASFTNGPNPRSVGSSRRFDW
jgi:hypothetical protein